MLKIKKEVTVSQLESHGFTSKRYSEYTGELTKLFHRKKQGDWLYVDLRDGVINSCERIDGYGQGFTNEQLVIIFNLIEDGLVEVNKE